jgi:long-chain fatty acid transport protein
MKSRFRRVSLLVVVLLQAASIALGDGLIRDGIGPISTGRGGTNQGFADNSAIILDNPGAMVNVAGNGLLELGVDTVIADVRYTNPLSDVTSKVRPLPMPVIGYIRKSQDDRWAGGIGVFSPAGFGASYGTVNSPVLGPSLYRSIGGLAKILPGVAYRVNDQLSVGLTVGIGISDIGLRGPYFLQSGPLAGVPADIALIGFGVAPTGSLGFQYQWTDDTTFGLTYTEQTNMKLHGGMNADIIVGPGTVISSHFDAITRMTWPRSVAFGVKHDLCEHRRIAADVIWYDWAHSFDQISLTLTNPTNPVVPIIVGSNKITDHMPLNWRNSISLRLGYEIETSDYDTWRAGYVYHGSPPPNSTLNPYLDGILEHAFSLGYSRKLPRADLNLAYQYNFGPTQYVGTSSIIGGDFDNSSLNAQAHFAMISFLFPF